MESVPGFIFLAVVFLVGSGLLFSGLSNLFAGEFEGSSSGWKVLFGLLFCSFVLACVAHVGFAVLTFASFFALYVWDKIDDKKRAKQLAEFQSKYPVAFDFKNLPPQDPAKQTHVLRLFDINSPKYLGSTERADIEYLIERFATSDNECCLNLDAKNDFHFCLGVLLDDVNPVFEEHLVHKEWDGIEIGTRIEISEISPGFREIISKRLIEKGYFILRWCQ